MLRGVKTTLSFAMALAGILAAGCGNNGSGTTSGNTTSGTLSTGPYYNLTPGICGEFSNDAGGIGPTIGLFIKSSVSPPGIELRRVRHGLKEESDFVSLDGGLVFLSERELSTSVGNTQEVYVTPLEYLPAPPLELNGQSLDSSSACASGASSPCITMHLDTNVAMSRPYTGPYAVTDGGMTEYKLNFTFTYDNDGGASATAEAWITPGIGFTDLFLPSDTGGYTDYLLVDIVSDGGACADH